MVEFYIIRKAVEKQGNLCYTKIKTVGDAICKL